VKQSEQEDEENRLSATLAALLYWQAFRVINALQAYETTLTVANLDVVIEAVIDLEREASELGVAIRPYLSGAADRAITAMQIDYNIGQGATVSTDFIQELLQAQESRFARDVTATSVRGIRAQIAKGIAEGEGYYQLRDRILGYYERQAQWRAGLAAQYETGTAYEAVRNALARAQGMAYKTWNTMRDANVCEFCAANERAGTIPIDQAFPSGNSQPLQHNSCRCWLTYSAESSDGERSTT
jgi:hypothetical protein